MSVLQKIREKISHAKAQQAAEIRDAFEAYKALVAAAVTGKDASADEAEEIILAAGYSFDDFERHVAGEQTRLQYEKVVATKADLDRRIAGIREREAALREEWKALHEKSERLQLEFIREHEKQRAEHRELLNAERWLNNYRGIERPTAARAATAAFTPSAYAAAAGDLDDGGDFILDDDDDEPGRP